MKTQDVMTPNPEACRAEDDALVAGYLREISAAPADEPAPER